MLIAIDFDGTVVSMAGRSYSDVTSPLQFVPGARAGLASLRKAGHVLLLYSARANRALLEDPALDPMVRSGARKVHTKTWDTDRDLNRARYQQMIDFVERELPGVFAAIDDGRQGKPCADLFIDDRGMRYGNGPTALSWQGIGRIYGEPVYGSVEG